MVSIPNHDYVSKSCFRNIDPGNIRFSEVCTLLIIKQLNNVVERGIDFLSNNLTICCLLHEIDLIFVVSFIFYCDRR